MPGLWETARKALVNASVHTDEYGRRVELSGFRGAPHTVDAIKRSVATTQASAPVRELAEKATSGLWSKDCLSEMLALYYLVLSRTRYLRDPRAVELVRSPRVVCRQILRGERPGLDCDDITALLCALLAACGIASQAATVAFKDMFYNGERQYSHVYCRGQEPRTGAWVILDPVAGNRSAEMRDRVVAVKYWPIA